MKNRCPEVVQDYDREFKKDKVVEDVCLELESVTHVEVHYVLHIQ